MLRASLALLLWASAVSFACLTCMAAVAALMAAMTPIMIKGIAGGHILAPKEKMERNERIAEVAWCVIKLEPEPFEPASGLQVLGGHEVVDERVGVAELAVDRLGPSDQIDPVPFDLVGCYKPRGGH